MTVWVWRPYVARRHLTLIHGPRHAGKSDRLSRMIARLDLDLVVFDNIFTHSMRKAVALQRIAALAKFHSCAMVVVMDASEMTSACKDQASVVLSVEQRCALRSISMNKSLLNKSVGPKQFHIEPSASNEYRSKLVWTSEQCAHACESV